MRSDEGCGEESGRQGHGIAAVVGLAVRGPSTSLAACYSEKARGCSAPLTWRSSATTASISGSPAARVGWITLVYAVSAACKMGWGEGSSATSGERLALILKFIEHERVEGGGDGRARLWGGEGDHLSTEDEDQETNGFAKIVEGNPVMQLVGMWARVVEIINKFETVKPGEEQHRPLIIRSRRVPLALCAALPAVGGPFTHASPPHSLWASSSSP